MNESQDVEKSAYLNIIGDKLENNVQQKGN